MIRTALKGLAYLFVALVVAVILLLAPVGYVETFCRGKIGAARTDPKMSDPAFWRAEANTFLTYPEWHIVYAYDGLAETLKTTDEYDFGYLGSIAGFWSSTCQMMRYADAHGGADGATRLMVHTIGVSFTLEMLMKAAYEETLGRLFAAIRGEEKTPQDLVARDMAVTYAAFLRQTPWYNSISASGATNSRRRQSPICCAAGSAVWRSAANGAPRSLMPRPSPPAWPRPARPSSRSGHWSECLRRIWS